MPAPIPLEPPVTSATLPLDDFACVAAIDILLVLTFCVLDVSVQNATQKVFSQGRSKTRPVFNSRSYPGKAFPPLQPRRVSTPRLTPPLLAAKPRNAPTT